MRERAAKVREELVYTDQQNPWLKVFFDHLKFGDGREERYNRVVEVDGRPGVAILPLDGQAVGLVRQYRYPIGQDVWEIPRGFGEGPDVKADAARELREETGYLVSPGEFFDLGSLHPNSGLLASTVALLAVDCAGRHRESSFDESEIAAFQWVGPERLDAMIRGNEIRDAFTLSALCRAAVAGLRSLGCR